MYYKIFSSVYVTRENFCCIALKGKHERTNTDISTMEILI